MKRIQWLTYTYGIISGSVAAHAFNGGHLTLGFSALLIGPVVVITDRLLASKGET